MLLWTFLHKILYGPIFSILLHTYYSGVELLGHVITLCSTFWVTAKPFSKLTVPFYILTSNVLLYPYQHWLLFIFKQYYIFYYITVQVDVKWYLIVALICTFLMTNYVEHLLSVYWPLVYIFWERSIQILCPLSVGSFVFTVELSTSFKYSWYKSYQIHDLQIFSPILRIVFSLYNFLKVQNFKFWWSLIYLCFSPVARAFGVIPKKLLPNPSLLRNISMFSAKSLIVMFLHLCWWIIS